MATPKEIAAIWAKTTALFKGEGSNDDISFRE